MKVKFCGAAGAVTGSCHLLTLDNGFKILLDCGLYQGRDQEMKDFNDNWLFDPSEIDVMVLSHAHIDHTGRIPKLTKDGFDGDIICTSATRDLCAIMLLDSASIQEREAEWENKRKRTGEPEVFPLYHIEDAQQAMEQFVSISYSRWFKISDDISVKFEDSGHILGSASVTLKITENGKERMIGFSGDIGRPDRPILRDPKPIEPVDILLCESTYGGKEHQGTPRDKNQLLEIINQTCVENKGKLIIPAFSIGRTQELVYMLDQLETEGKLPIIKVFVDSPLAINATEIFIMHPECYDRQILRYMMTDPNPFNFKGLTFTRTADQSKAINDLKEPCIIISASGMMNAGRIKHHISNNIEDANNTLLVIGYCAPHTLGGRLMRKPDDIRIFGQTKKVKANIVVMPSMSAHADQGEMMDFMEKQDKSKLEKIFLVHGEINRQTVFKEALLEEGFKRVEIPHLGQEYNI